MWHARWEGEGLLRNRFPALYESAALKQISVHRWRHILATNRNFDFINLAINDAEGQSALEQLNLAITNVSLNDNEDSVEWRWSNNGRFSVRSAYNFLVFDGFDDRKIRNLWRTRIPLRIKLFLWLAARNRIPTTDRLIKRGWQGPSICFLCGGEGEKLEHILFSCAYARAVWSRIFGGNHQLCSAILQRPGDLATRWERASRVSRESIGDLIYVCIAAVCWELWLERNRRVFEDRVSTVGECSRRINSTFEFWKKVLGG